MTERQGKANPTARVREMKDCLTQHRILVWRQRELLVFHLDLRTDRIESLHDVAGAHRTQNRSQSVVDGKDVCSASPVARGRTAFPASAY
jgi:hypothetical protein